MRQTGSDKSIVWNVALYLRLSRDDGQDESSSVTNQRKILMEYVEEFFDEPHLIVDEYTDDGETGTDIARPGFQRMMADVEAGKINCIIVKDLKRFMRNHAYQGFYLEQVFPEYGIRFITLGEPKLDTYRNPTAVYGFDVPMHGIMNDRFAQGTSEAIKRTFATKWRRGEFAGAFCAYGFTKDPANKNKLIVDEEAAEIVRDIFKWFLSGMSKGAIARRLNEFKIPNPAKYKRLHGVNYNNPATKLNDGLWSRETVGTILANEAYIGVMIQGKQRVVSYKIHDRVSNPKDKWVRVPDAMPAIIEKDEFELVQTLLAKNTKVPKKSDTVSLFAGFIRCVDCNKAMRRNQSKGVYYYTCRTNNEKGGCFAHSIRLDDLESAVFSAVKAQISFAQKLHETIGRIHQKPVLDVRLKRLEAMLESKKGEMVKMRIVNDDLYIDLKTGVIEKDTYYRLKERTESTMKLLGNAIEKIEQEIEACNTKTGSHPVLENFLKYANIQKLDREVLAALVDNIYVHASKEITIVYQHDDSLSLVQQFVADHQEAAMLA